MSGNLMAEWALMWGIPQAALDDLEARFTLTTCKTKDYKLGGSEAYTQSFIRLQASTLGYHLDRNNVGVFMNPQGRPVRVGLANDSKAMNEVIKSADLIGWKSVTITPEMIGRKVAIYASVECKHAGWKPGEDPDREKAQQRWAHMVLAAGGIAVITTGELPR